MIDTIIVTRDIKKSEELVRNAIVEYNLTTQQGHFNDGRRFKIVHLHEILKLRDLLGLEIGDFICHEGVVLSDLEKSILRSRQHRSIHAPKYSKRGNSGKIRGNW